MTIASDIKSIRNDELLITRMFDAPRDLVGEETVVTITFADEEGRTRMVVHHAPFLSVGARNGHTEGWSNAFERLAEQLARQERNQ